LKTIPESKEPNLSSRFSKVLDINLPLAQTTKDVTPRTCCPACLFRFLPHDRVAKVHKVFHFLLVLRVVVERSLDCLDNQTHRSIAPNQTFLLKRNAQLATAHMFTYQSAFPHLVSPTGFNPNRPALARDERGGPTATCNYCYENVTPGL